MDQKHKRISRKEQQDYIGRRTKKMRYRKVGSNWQPWDSRQGETSENPDLPSGCSNPKTLGSIPWRSRVRRNSFCVRPSQLLCRRVGAWPPFVCSARTQNCAHVKDPISICRNWVGLTSSGMETRKHYKDWRRKKKLGSAVLWLLAFPRESIPKFICIVLGQESYLI